MSPKYVVLLPAALAAVSLPASAVPISITESSPSYSQNFDTLASSGTENTALPDGWTISESGNSSNDFYRAGTGSGTTGDTYSFGAVGSIERAIGELTSGPLVSSFGVSFTNMGLTAIKSLSINYTGEQWRVGSDGRIQPDSLQCSISFDAMSLTSGAWNPIPQLEFVAVKSSRDAGTTSYVLNGNLAVNQAELAFAITETSIPIGSGFWLRWTGSNASGDDDGLAIDDFSLTATFAEAPGTAVPDGMPAGFAAAALLLALFLPRALERRPRS